ncbi:MAG: S-adenosylmethionine:tRNA ribosyltransferase-isomerase, partial [bacterium]
MYSLTDFDFNLPAELIAQTPLTERTQSRLLHVKPERFVDGLFTDVLSTLEPGDVLVFNDTQVINARFFGVKETGGRVEILVERVLDVKTVIAQIRASKTPV